MSGEWITEERPTFTVDEFSWVFANFERGGLLKSQKVEAHLLLAILEELRRFCKQQEGKPETCSFCGKPAPDSQTGSQWRTIETAPKDRWLITWREGEKHTSIASKREWPDGEAEWISGDGSTTITHHSYAPPTHYLMPPPAPDIRSEDAQDKWREFCKGCPHPGYCAGKRECYYGKPAGLESQTETKEEEA